MLNLRLKSLLVFLVYLNFSSTWAMWESQEEPWRQTNELARCIARQKLDRAYDLIAKGYPVEFSQEFRGKYTSPLNCAANQGDLNLAALLIEKNASFEPSGLSQRTPLHEAADRGHLPVVDLLCKHGAAVDQLDARGRTPLTEALMEGYLDIVSYLHQTQNADLGKDFLLKIAWEVGEKYLAMATYLISSGVELSFVNEKGRTPLHLACLKQNLPMVRLLIEAKATLEASDLEGNTALHLAAEVMDGSVWHYLLSLDADEDIKNHRGLSPKDVMRENYTRQLVVDARPGNIKSGRKMIDMGAIINRKSLGLHLGRTIYPTQAACQAALYGKLDFLRMLLECKGDVDVRSGSQAEGPLYHAAIHNHLPTAAFLIEQKACVNAQDNSGHTALHGAVIENYTDMVKLLLDAQADANIVCSDGSPLWLTVIRGNQAITALLIAAKATPEGNYGPHKRTVLHVAVRAKNHHLCRLLLDIGAQPQARDDEGQSVLDILNADKEAKWILGDLFNCLITR